MRFPLHMHLDSENNSKGKISMTVSWVAMIPHQHTGPGQLHML
jgi:hypothetical protein